MKCIRIIKSVINSFINPFDMEIVFQIIKILHKKIKKEFTVCPISKQLGEFIHILAFFLNSPEVVVSIYNSDKIHTISNLFAKIQDYNQFCNL